MTLSAIFTSKSVFDQQGCRALTFALASLSCIFQLQYVTWAYVIRLTNNDNVDGRERSVGLAVAGRSKLSKVQTRKGDCWSYVTCANWIISNPGAPVVHHVTHYNILCR